MALSIKTDIHTHTLFTRHAYSTIAENVAAARAAAPFVDKVEVENPVY